MALVEARCYPDLLVAPVLQLLASPTGGHEHCAGPLYPDFEAQGWARHCRGSGPVDVCPPAPPAGREIPVLDEALLWGGCLVDHFGHFTAEFIHRVLPATRARPDLRVLFVTPPGRAAQPLPAHLRDILAYLGVADRLLIVDRYVRVRELWVLPQAECLGGGPPPPDYLPALLECQRRLPPRPGGRVLFVSRSGAGRGLVGEAALDDWFRALGATVFLPERHAVAEQLATYLAYEHLVFSEGSALHGLQLLGALPGRVTVLSRRPMRMGEAFLRPRVAALDYVALPAGAVRGRTVDGRPADWTGLVFMRTEPLLALAATLFPEVAVDRVQALTDRLTESLRDADGPALRGLVEEQRQSALWCDVAETQRQLAAVQRYGWGVRMAWGAERAGVDPDRLPPPPMAGPLEARALRSTGSAAPWRAWLTQLARGEWDLQCWRQVARQSEAGADWASSDLDMALLLTRLSQPGPVWPVTVRPAPAWTAPRQWPALRPFMRRALLLRACCPARFEIDPGWGPSPAWCDDLAQPEWPLADRLVVALYGLLPGSRWPEALGPETWAGWLLHSLPEDDPPAGAAPAGPAPTPEQLNRIDTLGWAAEPAARTELEALARRWPREPRLWQARCRQALGRRDLLAALMAALIAWLLSDRGRFCAQLARCLDRVGHPAAAVLWWERAVRHEPDHEPHRQALQEAKRRLEAGV